MEPNCLTSSHKFPPLSKPNLREINTVSRFFFAPLVLRPGQPPEWIALPEGFLLGAMEESPYETRQILLAPGDRLLLYTDGVTEAMNGSKLFYQERRLIRVAEDHGQESPEALIGEVLRPVRAFAGSEPQSDDITMLVLAFRGGRNDSSERRTTMKIEREMENRS